MDHFTLQVIFSVLVVISMITFDMKRGISALCLIVLYSYLTYFILDGLDMRFIMSNLSYYTWDILRHTSISLLILHCIKNTQQSTFYFAYSVIILIQITFNVIMLTGLVSESAFNNLSALTTLAELSIFGYGIHTTITADNKRPGSYSRGFVIGGFVWARDCINYVHYSFKKGSK